MSNYLEDEINDHILSNATFAAGVDTFIGLWTDALTDASTGSTGTEVSGNGYARVDFTNDATNWPASASGSKSNGVAITFATASGGNWGTVTHAGILDALTVGNMWFWFDLTTSKTINDGDTAEFAIGAVTVAFD